jgi:hypothetical protein
MTTRCGIIWPVALAFCFVAGMLPLRAVTVIAPDIADTSLYQAHTDSNLGATTLVSGLNQQYSVGRALIKFDLSAIPAGAIITEVQANIAVSRQPDPDQHGGPVNSDFSLYRVLVDWGEGKGSAVTGTPALVGEATWSDRHYALIGSTPWTSPGGQIGTDFANDPSATTSIGGVGTYAWGSSPELVADVQSWLDDPSSNFGFALISGSETIAGSARRFASKEQNSALFQAPSLTITFTTAPEPGKTMLLLAGIAATGLRRRR